ncbi:putative quinol monooxygenase [Pedobacter jamesrossensis]|uniref:Quinol monooxygenase n=1 Tax=Pedobacter jamesrossensis TaxID=1908238 RepID=A0ABV8NLE2_9SPHI
MKKLALSIKFTTTDKNREEFKDILIDLFNVIASEEKFVDASIAEAMEDPNSILVYETWNSTVPEFMEKQMAREYRIPFEKALVNLGVKREPEVFFTIKEWKA